MRIDNRNRHETLNQRINLKGNKEIRDKRPSGYALFDKPRYHGYEGFYDNESDHGDQLINTYDHDYSKSDNRIREIVRKNRRDADEFLTDWEQKNNKRGSAGVVEINRFQNEKNDNPEILKKLKYPRYQDKYSLSRRYGVSWTKATPKTNKQVESFIDKLKKAEAAAEHANSLLDKYL